MAAGKNPPRSNSVQTPTKKGPGPSAAPPGSFTPKGDTPSNKLPTTRPAGNKSAESTKTIPGQPSKPAPGKMNQGMPKPGTLPAQQPSTQT